MENKMKFHCQQVSEQVFIALLIWYKYATLIIAQNGVVNFYDDLHL